MIKCWVFANGKGQAEQAARDIEFTSLSARVAPLFGQCLPSRKLYEVTISAVEVKDKKRKEVGR